MPKIIDHLEFEQEDGKWTSRKIHDGGDFVMERINQEEIDEDIAFIERDERPPWTLLGLPKILVDGEIFRERDQI